MEDLLSLVCIRRHMHVPEGCGSTWTFPTDLELVIQNHRIIIVGRDPQDH